MFKMIHCAPPPLGRGGFGRLDSTSNQNHRDNTYLNIIEIFNKLFDDFESMLLQKLGFGKVKIKGSWILK